MIQSSTQGGGAWHTAGAEQLGRGRARLWVMCLWPGLMGPDTVIAPAVPHWESRQRIPVVFVSCCLTQHKRVISQLWSSPGLNSRCEEDCVPSGNSEREPISSLFSFFRHHSLFIFKGSRVAPSNLSLLPLAPPLSFSLSLLPPSSSF